jgi:hypothetical protein
MKKWIMSMFFICLFVFSACQNEQTPPLQCGEDEIIVDGACQVVKTDFEKAFDATAEINNYTLTVTIQQLEDLYEMTLRVDVDKSQFVMGDQVDYYEKTSTGYDHYFQIDGGFRKESVSEVVNTTGFHFFKDLEPSWFQLVSERHFLKTEYLDDVAAFFQASFPGSEVSNLELTIGDMYFDSMSFQVTVDSVMYQFTMTFSMIGETQVTLPSV